MPPELQIKQRGEDPEHYEIMPRQPMPEEQYKAKLKEVQFEKVDGEGGGGVSAQALMPRAPANGWIFSMRSSDQEYEVVFPASYEGQWEEECSFKGWLSGVIVRLRGGDEFTLVFVDMHRLAQMMEDQIAAGVGYLAEPGLVIVSEVRRSNMEAAIQGLVRERFFESLRPAHPSAQAPTA